jgi:hypothetical protein
MLLHSAIGSYPKNECPCLRRDQDLRISLTSLVWRLGATRSIDARRRCVSPNGTCIASNVRPDRSVPNVRRCHPRGTRDTSQDPNGAVIPYAFSRHYHESGSLLSQIQNDIGRGLSTNSKNSPAEHTRSLRVWRDSRQRNVTRRFYLVANASRDPSRKWANWL